VGDVSPAMEIAAGLRGGSLAATSHFTKTGTRLLINTSPEPVSNWAASFTEDILVIGGLWAALTHPILFLILLVIFMAVVIWMLPKIWGLLKIVVQKIGGFLGLVEKPVEAANGNEVFTGKALGAGLAKDQGSGKP
jgi:hypothetical protein